MARLLLLVACATLAAAGALSPNERIAAYLHSRGEGLHISGSGPAKVVYQDWRDVNWDKPELNIQAIADAGFNVAIMAFYLSGSGAADLAKAWESVDNATRAQTISYAHSKGTVVLVSAGGATDIPYTHNATQFGAAAAQWALDYNLDGVDFDLENLGPGFVASGLTAPELIAWMVEATLAARAVLGPAGIITHAPQAPYFGSVGPGGRNPWVGPSGGYTAVWQGTATGTDGPSGAGIPNRTTGLGNSTGSGNAIDWFNTQFYNQGTCYMSNVSLFYEANGDGSCGSFPGTSVSELVAMGIPAEAILVGKPLETSDAGSGWVAPTTLHTWFQAAAAPPLRWSAGFMTWSWETADAPRWLQQVYPNGTATRG